DFQAHVPAVKASDPWANQKIGILITSTAGPTTTGGYWDLDNVRLTERTDAIVVPNYSFESPTTAFVDPSIGSWQKTPKPDWYDESGGNLWSQLTGVFVNTAPGASDHIDNVDANQALYLFALPTSGVFQDYNSLDGTNTTPSHAFNATFEPGHGYDLTVAVVGGGGGMIEGSTLELALYYRDSSN